MIESFKSVSVDTGSSNGHMEGFGNDLSDTFLIVRVHTNPFFRVDEWQVEVIVNCYWLQGLNGERKHDREKNGKAS